MKLTITTLGALLLGATASVAGGIERAPQSLAVLFEEGNYAELSFGGANPKVKGKDIAGFSTGDVAQGYGFFGLAYKHQFNDNLSAAIIVEQPFGADIRYPMIAAPLAAYDVLDGTRVLVNSTTYTGLLRYKFENNFSVHGGIRASRADGQVKLSGAGYGAFSGYDLDIDGAWGLGWVAGAAYEIPELAARVSLTYNSPISHDFDMTESGPIVGALTGGATDTVSGKHKVKTPRSWMLEAQSGVAKDTLVFGSVRWVKWSEFKVDNFVFPQPTVAGPVDLVTLEDTTTYTLGVGRKFTDNWSGSASFTYEPSKGDTVSPLAPYNGRKGITLAAIYTQDNVKITTGINYSKLGGTELGVGPNGNKRTVAEMDDGELWGVGVRVGYSF
ncbi:outer membrane protein transport protein [Paracoccus sp. (in: a-proteobacteria)]|uniref:OmpP1/FadL family transporter n=1 Tax=Paracoccus sp. TaxID=267 RepID=UPI002897000B|nr:outer membrane protein transport protein [Paracoccus sp. (in: a-proteobacteria)]